MRRSLLGGRYLGHEKPADVRPQGLSRPCRQGQEYRHLPQGQDRLLAGRAGGCGLGARARTRPHSVECGVTGARRGNNWRHGCAAPPGITAPGRRSRSGTAAAIIPSIHRTSKRSSASGVRFSNSDGHRAALTSWMAILGRPGAIPRVMNSWRITASPGWGTARRSRRAGATAADSAYMLDVNISSTRRIADFWGLSSAAAAN